MTKTERENPSPSLATPGIPQSEPFRTVRFCASAPENLDGTLAVIAFPLVLLPSPGLDGPAAPSACPLWPDGPVYPVGTRKAGAEKGSV
jgi:hypothetical protein